MKYLLIASFALASLTISAQNTIISRPQQKKEQPSKTSRSPKKRNLDPPRRPQPKPKVAEPPKPTLTASFANGELIANGVRYSFAKVEGGTFTMGATSEMQNSYSGEIPTHKVTLTNNYYMGRTEVTQSLWKAVMGSNPSHFQGDNRPVDNVSWDDCQKFISKLNEAAGVTFRLPSEAEWEFAARGGLKTRHFQYSGSNVLTDVAWFAGNSEGQTHSVGMKLPNELGLFDMTGNVAEWCNDLYDTYSTYPLTDPTGPYSGSERVTRGVCATNEAKQCRISIRGHYSSNLTYNGQGFRLTVTAEPSLKANVDVSRRQEISYVSFRVKGVTFEMAKVEAGSFMMGATPEQELPAEDEKPMHPVTLTKNFYLGKTEVTQALWKAVMGKNPSENKGNNKPVDCVSWNDCQKFLSKLNAITGKQFRLPTEAEWEYAARGSVNAKNCQYSGSNNLADVGWFGGGLGPYEVAQKQPNELGLYDMSGNVGEWCADCREYPWSYNAQEYTDMVYIDPLRTPGPCRVIRGASWTGYDSYCRCSSRGSDLPESNNKFYGLRLALSE